MNDRNPECRLATVQLAYNEPEYRSTGKLQATQRLPFSFLVHASYGTTCGVVADNALNVTLNHSNYTGSVKALLVLVETTGRKYGHCHSTRYYRT